MSSIFVVTVADVLTFSMFSILAILGLVLWSLRTWQQRRCAHDGPIGETQACDAICHKCGKNLGFIGTWRKQHLTKDPS